MMQMEYILTKQNWQLYFFNEVTRDEKDAHLFKWRHSLLTSVFLLIIFSYCHAMTITLSCFLLQTHKCWHLAGTYLKEAPRVSSWGKSFIDDPFFVLCHQSISISSCLNPYIARKNIWEGNLRRGKIHFGSQFQRFQSMASGLHYCGPWKQEHNLE